MANWTSDSGGVINLDQVVQAQKVIWGTADTPVEANIGYNVFMVDGSSFTVRGAEATSFNTAYNPAP